jgi:hypothetical protein
VGVLFYLRGRRCLLLERRMRALLLAGLVVLLGVGQLQGASSNPGNILIGNQSTDTIMRVDALTGTQAIIPSGGFLQNSFGLVIDPTGRIIVSDMPGGPA